MLAAICMPFYLRMSVGMTALMGVWLALSLAAVVVVDRSALSLGWSAAALWLLAWAVQVWGHKVEGKKPSFVDDLVFLLVGPMFVSIELAHKLGLRRSGVVN